MLEVWSVSYAHYAMPRREIRCERDMICTELQHLADAKGVGQLEVEAYTDEVHTWFVQGGRRRKFVWVQFEGRQ